MSPTVGYQEDGSYVPCPDCRAVPYEDPPGLPGRPVLERWSEVHRGDCPRVALPRETQRRLQEKFDEFDQCRARAWAAAQTAWIC